MQSRREKIHGGDKKGRYNPVNTAKQQGKYQAADKSYIKENQRRRHDDQDKTNRLEDKRRNRGKGNQKESGHKRREP